MKQIITLLLVIFIANIPLQAAMLYGYEDDEKEVLEIIFNDDKEQKSSDFEKRQEEVLAWVRDVNYRTRVGITERDKRVLQYIVGTLTFGLGLPIVNRILDEKSVQIVDFALKGIKKYSDEEIYSKNLAYQMPTLEVEQIYQRIKKRPFLVLLIGELEYNDIVAQYPEVSQLFENMYIFFQNRSIVLGDEYNKNIDDIERITRHGRLDPFATWQILADYTKFEQENENLEKRFLYDLHYRLSKMGKELKRMQRERKYEERVEELTNKYLYRYGYLTKEEYKNTKMKTKIPRTQHKLSARKEALRRVREIMDAK